MEKNYDIVIVGAGPSGCACALELQQSGLQVALIDKEEFPRDKICGDAIPGPAFKAMEKINPDWAQQMKKFADKQKIKTSSIFAPNGKKVSLDWVSYSYNSKRIDFDNFLFELVKKETDTIIINERINKVITTEESSICFLENGETLNSKIVIGCDGAYSIVRRFLDKKFGLEKPEASAVRAYYKNILDLKPLVNEFHFFKEFPGYFWIFPLANGGANVGFGIAQDSKDGTNINLRKSLEHIITKIPSVANRFKNAEMQDKIKGFGLPIWTKKKILSGNRFMLCGDAASLTDPMQGHGIDKGMWSGFFAAEQAIQCIAKNKFDARFISSYDDKIDKKLGAELSRSAFFMRSVIKYPWLVSLMVSIGQFKKLTTWFARKLKI